MQVVTTTSWDYKGTERCKYLSAKVQPPPTAFMSLKGSCLCEAVKVEVHDPAPVIERGLELCRMCLQGQSNLTIDCTHCRKATGAM